MSPHMEKFLRASTIKTALFIKSDVECFVEAQGYTQAAAERIFREAGASPKAADMLSALLSLGIMHASAPLITKGGDL